MKNRYEINTQNEIIRNDSGTYTAENYVETYENLNELFYMGVPKYYLKDGTIIERREDDILDLLDHSTERENYRKAYCQQTIRKLYTVDKEFQIQRKAILDPDNEEFKTYFNAVEKIIKQSKKMTISQLLEAK